MCTVLKLKGECIMASFRKQGSVWQYRVRYKDPYSDDWKEVSKSGFKTKKEAQIVAQQKEQELMNGFEQGDMNTAFYFRNWLSNYVKDKLKPMELTKIKPMMYQKFIDEKIESGLSTETARRIHNVVFQACKRAMINGYITKNPCENVSIKKREV
jgi:hypothetical protein